MALVGESHQKLDLLNGQGHISCVFTNHDQSIWSLIWASRRATHFSFGSASLLQSSSLSSLLPSSCAPWQSGGGGWGLVQESETRIFGGREATEESTWVLLQVTQSKFYRSCTKSLQQFILMTRIIITSIKECSSSRFITYSWNEIWSFQTMP